MTSAVRNLRLNVKMAAIAVIGVIVTSTALVSLTVWQSRRYNSVAQHEVEALINSNLDSITLGIYNLVRTEDEAVQQNVNINLKVARSILQRNGGISLSDRLVSWQAVNQLTGAVTTIELPAMLIGGRGIERTFDPGIPSPVVDEVRDLVGDTATIFQLMNPAGDMLRVATNITDGAGKRAIGTYIPAVNPDGTANAVISAVMDGRTYRGKAFVVNEWYLTAYEPILDPSDRLVGMLYVGIRQKAVEQRIRQVILRTTVGKTGYIYVLGSRGEERGQYIISYKGERDGEYIWDTLDSNGNYVIRDIIAKATSLGPEELATVRYLWQNTGEEEPRWKIARLVYYKPWDWVIGTSVYEDELQGYWAVLRDGHSRITKSMLMAGLLITLGTGILGVFVTWRMTRPIEEMRRAAERIIKGDFDQRVTVSSADEIGLLARSFNFMTERLRETMDGLRRSRDELEEMVAQRTAQLEAAKRNAESASEAKTAFLANMSHELRTPLNAVLGFTELMRIDPEVTPKQMESLEIITRSGEHLLALINNVLEISRIETGRMTILEKETDLFQLLHETQSLLQVRAAEKGLSFTLSLSPDLPRYVITDSGKLRQILINLIGNAIKYTERGGVTLRAAVIERESAQRAVISFMVEDTGIGIRAEDRDKLFLPFVRLEEQPPGPAGSGLGLALTKQYVEQMHGTINFTSAPGRGSVFHFEMPFSVIRFDELPQEPLRGRPVGLEEGQPHRRLLIVEDNAENRLLLRNFLEPFGFEVFEVVNGQEALDFFDELKPDLIWMDIRMPSMDGIEATRRIRARPDGAGTRIIALTAHALEDELHAIIAAGCDGFIRKPYREAEIIAALETHLRLRFLYSEETPQQRAGKRAGLTGIESWLSVRLERLPRDLLRELSESVLLLDRNLCVEKIGKIGELDQELAVELRSIVDRRQYGELLSILERISGEVEG